jgi:hypothetical protein
MSGGNSIDNLKTPRLNFYSCMDDSTIDGWEMLPKKYKQVNPKA